MTSWLTADTHFGHTNIIKYCNRPFSTCRKMDEVIINNINQVVEQNDILYHLGDFSFGGHKQIEWHRKKIKCKNIVLILGNHDRILRKHWKYNLTALFSNICELLSCKIDGIDVTLCHYAMRRWNKSHHGAYHFFGHSHGGLEPFGRSMDVGVDTNNYKPYRFQDLIELLKPISSTIHRAG